MSSKNSQTKIKEDVVKDGIKNSRYIDVQVRKRYLEGRKNAVVKVYFYIERGLQLVNDFKYVIAGVLALYFAINLDNIIFIPITFFVALPILWLIGYIWITYAVKSMEWINIEHATFWTRYNYSLQEKQLEFLEKLCGELAELNEHNKLQRKKK